MWKSNFNGGHGNFGSLSWGNGIMGENYLNKREICFIRPMQRHDDYWHYALRQSGYKTLIPYKDYFFTLRVIREIWFRLGLPKKEIWYNPQIKKCDAKIYFIKDPLMTVDFLEWLRKEKRDARIIMDFDNRAGTTIDPNLIIDPTIEKWSYDPDDCEKYKMRLKPKGYLDYYRIKRAEYPIYDIVFVGRDKGRLEYLLKLEKCFKKCGLKTYFRISPNRFYMRYSRKYYKPIIPYSQYLELIAKSKAILNIMPDNQKGLTMRDFEAVFNGIKCITNNKAIKEFELYDPSRYFVLGVDDINTINDFLSTDFKRVNEEELDEYRLDKAISKIIVNEKELEKNEK